MNKIKITCICLLIPLFILMLFSIKNKMDTQRKIALAHEVRKALECLMFDLHEARENTLIDLPPDGLWHHHIAFIQSKQGPLEYVVKAGHLFRINKGKSLLIADNIGDLRIRRHKDTPDILEVQVSVQKNVSIISNLKIRMRQ